MRNRARENTWPKNCATNRWPTHQHQQTNAMRLRQKLRRWRLRKRVPEAEIHPIDDASSLLRAIHWRLAPLILNWMSCLQRATEGTRRTRLSRCSRIGEIGNLQLKREWACCICEQPKHQTHNPSPLSPSLQGMNVSAWALGTNSQADHEAFNRSNSDIISFICSIIITCRRMRSCNALSERKGRHHSDEATHYSPFSLSRTLS